MVTTFENDGAQIESTINYKQSVYDEDGKHTDSGDVSFLYKHPDIGVFNGVGTWECQHLNIEEVPVEELPENYVPTVAVHAGEPDEDHGSEDAGYAGEAHDDAHEENHDEHGEEEDHEEENENRKLEEANNKKNKKKKKKRRRKR